MSVGLTSLSTTMYFYFFPWLPPEIRRNIFLMATEPRIVHVKPKSLVELTEQEQEDGVSHFDAFASRLAPWNLTVDPMMAHFAHDWQSSIRLPRVPPRSSWNFHPRNPGSAIQTQLTAFGFTTSKPRRLPWTPTTECPELPPHLLYADPRAAWKLARPHRLFSNAPIPPLLHTCFESREVLMSYGYQLAFGTRTAAPRTWFCFSRDVLHLPKLHHQWSRNVPIHSWNCSYREDTDLGVWDFDPQDLTRVRRLALDNVVFSPGGFSDTSRTLRACQNVVELLAVRYRLGMDTLSLMSKWSQSKQYRRIGAFKRVDQLKKMTNEYDDLAFLGEQFHSDKGIWEANTDVAFDVIVWEEAWQAGDLEERRRPLESWEYRSVRQSLLEEEVQAKYICWELQQEQVADMLSRGAETGGEVKTRAWKLPLVRQAMVGTRNGIDALLRTRCRFRRRHQPTLLRRVGAKISGHDTIERTRVINFRIEIVVF
ncbi:hypothetical protein QBC39DRAFT_433612 [Podospora conica]|nr:hypothetical protein QBC39DRAFT_433612 [Schizothecium conicum]